MPLKTIKSTFNDIWYLSGKPLYILLHFFSRIRSWVFIVEVYREAVSPYIKYKWSITLNDKKLYSLLGYCLFFFSYLDCSVCAVKQLYSNKNQIKYTLILLLSREKNLWGNTWKYLIIFANNWFHLKKN